MSRFFIDLISCSSLSFKSAVSLTIVLFHRKKKSSGVESGERGDQEIGPPRPIHLPLNFSFNYVRNLEKLSGAPSC